MGANSLTAGNTILAYGATSKAFPFHSYVLSYTGGWYYTPWYTFGGYWVSGSSQSSSIGFPTTKTVNAGYYVASSKGGTANVQTSMKMVYTLTVSPSGSGTVSGGGTYIEGTSVTLTATPATHFAFTQWSDASTSATRAVTVTADASYVATFAQSEWRTYAVTEDAAKGTVALSGWSSGVYGPAGVSRRATATPVNKAGVVPANSLYEFLGWFRNGVTAAAYSTATADLISYAADTTYTARFTPKATVAVGYSTNGGANGTATLTFQASGNVKTASATVQTEAATVGFTVTATATLVNAEYVFSGWYTSSSGTLLSTALTYVFTPASTDVAGGLTVYAKFLPIVRITVTTEVLLDSVAEASDDGNALTFTPTGAYELSGDLPFAVTLNAAHYWGKPDITVSEITIGGSSSFKAVTFPAADYTIDADGNVTLPLVPLQTWVAEQTPIAFKVTADFPSVPVGATVVRGKYAGTWPWTYAVTYPAWTSRAAVPNPENPLYGDTGTIRIDPGDAAKFTVGTVLVKAGVTEIYFDSYNGADNYFEFPVTVTGPLEITVDMTALASVEVGALPAGIGANIIASSGEGVSSILSSIGYPVSVIFTGTSATHVFEGWDITGYAPYVDSDGDMVAIRYQTRDNPVVVTPNGPTVLTPSFVVADSDPFVVLQFFDASANAVFDTGGLKPLVVVSGGTSSTRAAMMTQIGALGSGNFDTAFAESGSAVYYAMPELGDITFTATGTDDLPFLRFEKAPITKGNGTDTDCVIGDWSAVGNGANPVTIPVNVSVAYRAVFGEYQPQTNTAHYRASGMRVMGSVDVTGYDRLVAVNGSVSAKTGYGSAVTFSAAPNVGYVFNGWYSLSGETYTLLTTEENYTVEQGTSAFAYYASFAQDTTVLYEMEAGEVNKTMVWKSKRFEMGRPASYSACRCDADGYPVRLQAHAFSSPSAAGATDAGVTVCEDQDSRRLPTLRKERFFEFSVESVHPVVGMSFSTTMQGLS